MTSKTGVVASAYIGLGLNFLEGVDGTGLLADTDLAAESNVGKLLARATENENTWSHEDELLLYGQEEFKLDTGDCAQALDVAKLTKDIKPSTANEIEGAAECFKKAFEKIQKDFGAAKNEYDEATANAVVGTAELQVMNSLTFDNTKGVDQAQLLLPDGKAAHEDKNFRDAVVSTIAGMPTEKKSHVVTAKRFLLKAEKVAGTDLEDKKLRTDLFDTNKVDRTLGAPTIPVPAKANVAELKAGLFTQIKDENKTFKCMEAVKDEKAGILGFFEDTYNGGVIVDESKAMTNDGKDDPNENVPKCNTHAGKCKICQTAVKRFRLAKVLKAWEDDFAKLTARVTLLQGEELTAALAALKVVADDYLVAHDTMDKTEAKKFLKVGTATHGTKLGLAVEHCKALKACLHRDAENANGPSKFVLTLGAGADKQGTVALLKETIKNIDPDVDCGTS